MSSTLKSFTEGDLVISVVGDGDGSGTYTDNQASSITLEEITTTGEVVGTMVLPQTTTVVDGVTEYAVSGEYGSSSEGELHALSRRTRPEECTGSWLRQAVPPAGPCPLGHPQTEPDA